MRPLALNLGWHLGWHALSLRRACRECLRRVALGHALRRLRACHPGLVLLAVAAVLSPAATVQPQASVQANEPSKPTSHTTRKIEGWTVKVDDRLLQAPNEETGRKALRYLENKLFNITVVVPKDRVKKLQ